MANIAIRDFYPSRDTRYVKANLVEAGFYSAEDADLALTGYTGSILVAETEGQILGSIIWVDNQDMPQLKELAVLEKYRGQGVGTKLLAAAEVKLLESGATEAEVQVSPNNDQLRNWLAKRGYEEFGLAYMAKKLEGIPGLFLFDPEQEGSLGEASYEDLLDFLLNKDDLGLSVGSDHPDRLKGNATTIWKKFASVSVARAINNQLWRSTRALRRERKTMPIGEFNGKIVAVYDSISGQKTKSEMVAAKAHEIIRKLEVPRKAGKPFVFVNNAQGQVEPLYRIPKQGRDFENTRMDLDTAYRLFVDGQIFAPEEMDKEIVIVAKEFFNSYIWTKRQAREN